MEYYYQIALTNVPFDNSYKNVLRFESRSEQETYFNVSSLFSSKPKVNFSVGSLTMTNVCYDSAPNESINELLSKNYCIVKDTSPNKTLDYYYYFITNMRQENANRVYLSLEIDVMQTYYLNLKFSDCLINRAHLNRWIDNGDDTVSFDGTPTSELFERESIQNVAKRLTKRTKVSMYPDTELGNWMNNNILGWLYIYMDPLNNFNFIGVDEDYSSVTGGRTIIKNKSLNGGSIPSNITVATYPIYKTDNRIIFTNNNMKGHGPSGYINASSAWGEKFIQIGTINSALSCLANLNDGYSKIYAVKFSELPPFNNISGITYSIINNNIEVPCQLSNGRIINPFIDNTGGTSTGILTYSVYFDLNGAIHSTISIIGYQEPNHTAMNYSVEKQILFDKSEIIGADKNSKFNPKLLSGDYFNLRISDNTENGFDYDLQKLNKTDLKVLYTESIVPDMAKKYIRFSDLSGVYIEETEKNLTGFVSNNDASLILPTSAYQSMLANNKNFFLQNSINRQFNFEMATGGGIIAGAKSGGLESAVIGGALGAIGASIKNAKDIISEGLTIDNLQNAPSNITGAKGNVIFENMYSENGIIVEEYDILEAEKEKINDFMCMFGFTYNRLGNVKNFDNIRKYYNYIKADIEQVEGVGININDNIHNKLRQIYSNGVRIWNTDTFDYSKENYENWLEEQEGV